MYEENAELNYLLHTMMIDLTAIVSNWKKNNQAGAIFSAAGD